MTHSCLYTPILDFKIFFFLSAKPQPALATPCESPQFPMVWTRLARGATLSDRARRSLALLPRRGAPLHLLAPAPAAPAAAANAPAPAPAYPFGSRAMSTTLFTKRGIPNPDLVHMYLEVCFSSCLRWRTCMAWAREKGGTERRGREREREREGER